MTEIYYFKNKEEKYIALLKIHKSQIKISSGFVTKNTTKLLSFVISKHVPDSSEFTRFFFITMFRNIWKINNFLACFSVCQDFNTHDNQKGRRKFVLVRKVERGVITNQFSGFGLFSIRTYGSKMQKKTNFKSYPMVLDKSLKCDSYVHIKKLHSYVRFNYPGQTVHWRKIAKSLRLTERIHKGLENAFTSLFNLIINLNNCRYI